MSLKVRTGGPLVQVGVMENSSCRNFETMLPKSRCNAPYIFNIIPIQNSNLVFSCHSYGPNHATCLKLLLKMKIVPTTDQHKSFQHGPLKISMFLP